MILKFMWASNLAHPACKLILVELKGAKWGWCAIFLYCEERGKMKYSRVFV